MVNIYEAMNSSTERSLLQRKLQNQSDLLCVREMRFTCEKSSCTANNLTVERTTYYATKKNT